MPISVGAPSQLVASTAFSNATLTVAGNTVGLTNNSSTSSSSLNLSGGTQTAPVIQVNSEGTIESPFIGINQQSAETQNISGPQAPDFRAVDNTPRQIRALDSEQQEIQTRSETLEEEEQAIEREISELRRRELEINRKRFELQRQSNIGQIVNLQI